MAYAYKLASDPTSVTLPTTRVQTTSYDSANRISQVQDTYNSTTSTHASGISYFPNRVMKAMALGHINGAGQSVVENTSLDSLGRLQIIARNVQIGAKFPISLGFTYGAAGKNNGNLTQEAITTWNPNGVAGILESKWSGRN